VKAAGRFGAPATKETPMPNPDTRRRLARLRARTLAVVPEPPEFIGNPESRIAHYRIFAGLSDELGLAPACRLKACRRAGRCAGGRDGAVRPFCAVVHWDEIGPSFIQGLIERGYVADPEGAASRLAAAERSARSRRKRAVRSPCAARHPTAAPNL
jgi:hypothetical protein